MNANPDDRTARLRWGVYLVLIAVSVGDMSGRLLAVNSVDKSRIEKNRVAERLAQARERLTAEGKSGDALEQELEAAEQTVRTQVRLQRPFLSANDRSRWATVRSLVEHGTYEIDEIIKEPTWDTIDKVRHVGRDGQMHFYSSKPPLLATLLAGPYWLIHRLSGALFDETWTLGDHPYEIGRAMLVTVNILPMILLFVIVAWLAERLGTSDWGRIFVVATAALGTGLSTFAVVLNNHLAAAVSAAVAISAVVRITCDGERRWRYFALVGLAAAFTAATELPALAFLAAVALMLAWRSPSATFVAFLPAALVVAGAFFATNWIAHESFRPPYLHRSKTDPADNWYEYTYTDDGEERASYWVNPEGLDRGEPSRGTYALHVLVGHHGILSLTPVWLLSLLGMAMWLVSGDWPRRELAALVAALTAVCLVFYIGFVPQEQRNYGGMTSGFRWMFWFAPLWLVVMIPAADRLARSFAGKALAAALLTISVLSASYPTWNPWTQPWIYHWLEWYGVVG